MPMKRQEPSASEYRCLVEYFLMRLAPRPDQVHKPGMLSLEKGPTHYARKELVHTRGPGGLVDWSYRWCSDDDWTRARSSVRSQRYKDRNRLTRLSVTLDFKDLVASRADAAGLPLWKYLAAIGLDEATLRELEAQNGVETTDTARAS